MKYAYQLQNIKYAYGKTLALSLPNVAIRFNKTTALIGPNGCGKSTLLNLLAFLAKSQHGHIRCLSETLTRQPSRSLTKRIALLAQKPYMLRGSVFNNLDLALQFHGICKSERAALIKATLDQLNGRYLMQQQATTLSGGELQTVALARAIVTNPDILLMDEPFSHLDHSSTQTLEKFIRSYVKNSNKTLIFSTHNHLQGAVIADDVLALVKGKLTETPLINVFRGQCRGQLFDTGNIQILLASNDQSYQHVAIDPSKIVLSKQALKSSMRNQYQGKVLAISNETNKIRIAVLAGELFQVLITQQALEELDVSLNSTLWVNFKANAMVAF